MLTREQILGLSDLPREEVRIPEWGGVVFVRALTGSERDQLPTICSEPVWPIYSRGSDIVPEQASQATLALHGTSGITSIRSVRKQEDVALALMIPLAVKMGDVLV